MSEQTDVLVIGDTVAEGTVLDTDTVTVRTKNTSEGLDSIRGCSPDLLVSCESTYTEHERANVIEPMQKMGTEVAPWSASQIESVMAESVK